MENNVILKNLEKIANKYCGINHNEDNYNIGGGLDSQKFASRRHEDAKYDDGKLTSGEINQLFKKATLCELGYVKKIIDYAIPDPEWHHAGKLPKSYGGGMKKTYFYNSSEICDMAKNWFNYVEKFQLYNLNEKIKEENKKEIARKQAEFLGENAIYMHRVEKTPPFFLLILEEMNGKYGWFDCSGKSYNMTKYYTGYAFKSFEKRVEYFQIK